MNSYKQSLLAPITDENDPEWLTPFIPGFDLLVEKLNDADISCIAATLLKLVGNDNEAKSNWKLQALKSGLRQ